MIKGDSSETGHWRLPLLRGLGGATLVLASIWGSGGVFHRLIRTAVLLLSALLLAPGQAAAQAAPRIVAVGDLHGDYDAWMAIARAAQLVDAGGHWSGGKAVLVQMGDVVDRGPASLPIIRNLQQLQREAPVVGGRVVIILGNHEAMNVLGDLRYVTPQDFAAFADSRSLARRERLYGSIRRNLEAEARKANPDIRPSQVRDQWLAKTPLGWVEHRAAWAPAGELGRWARGNPAMVKIGDTLFVHGGLSSEYAPLGIDEINRRVAAAMTAAAGGPASILEDPFGPLWYRGLVTRDPRVDPDGAEASAGKTRPPIEKELAAVLTATGAKRVVVGHTPSLKGIIIANNGQLIRIDSGISRYYGGPLTWLEIAGDRVTPHTVPRPAGGTP